MTIVWQYGSNMDEKRLNGSDRLNGAAKFIGLAIARGFNLAFTHTNKDGIGVSDIVKADPADYVIGCLYEVPDSEMSRMDEIEGVNSHDYEKTELPVMRLNKRLAETSEKLRVTTYVVVKKEKESPKTDANYANHILQGIRDHKIGAAYFDKVKAIILKNNPDIQEKLIVHSDCPISRICCRIWQNKWKHRGVR
jgi:gamma-glutamylcyclotransferase (GGCT)/AIG2-like uncharacterized protein YtfP